MLNCSENGERLSNHVTKMTQFAEEETIRRKKSGMEDGSFAFDGQETNNHFASGEAKHSTGHAMQIYNCLG